MEFTALTPARLIEELAEWVRRRVGESTGSAAGSRGDRGTVIGFDGPDDAGVGALADQVAEAVRTFGLPVVRASTTWWWRPAALRLELGRQDIDMLLTGWVDAEAIRRELVTPVLVGGLPYISELRDPATDRSVRQRTRPAPRGAVLLLDGPFLLATGLPVDGRVALLLRPPALRRVLPDDKRWWTTAFDLYQIRYRSTDTADVLVAYDHPSHPAAAGLAGGR